MNLEKIKKKIGIEMFDDAKVFKINDEVYDAKYEFPFTCLDQSGKGLGRIEWHLEPFWIYDQKEQRYYINLIWLWAQQTTDERYLNKIFEIPLYTQMLQQNVLEHGDGFFQNLWRIQPMKETSHLAFSAYPKDNHNVLKIETSSSIMNKIFFDHEEEHQ